MFAKPKPDWLLASIGGVLFCAFAAWTIFSISEAFTTGNVTVNSRMRGAPMLSVPWQAAWGLFSGQIACLAGAASWFFGALTKRSLLVLAIALMLGGGFLGLCSGILTAAGGMNVVLGTLFLVGIVQSFAFKWKAMGKMWGK